VTSTHYLYSAYNLEHVQVVTDINFNATNGAMHAGFDRTVDSKRVETSNGRSGESMAIVNGGRDVYYAYMAGASNDTAMAVTRLRVDPTTSAMTPTASGIVGRINILFAGR
jgi:hypothetical protein